jgi:hypothetical protein
MKPRRPSAFRQGDLTKTVKAVIAAGLRVVGVKVSVRGDIEILTGSEAKAEPETAINEWDEGLRHDKSST